MIDIIKIDKGVIIRGEKQLKKLGKEILEYCIKVASGEELPKAVV